MKKYFKIGIVLLAFGALFNSCESTLDINESEVGFTTDLVSPDLLLAGAIQAPRFRFEVTTSELGSIMMNQWAGDINNVTGGFQDEFRLNINQNFYTTVWRDLYRGMGTYQAIIATDGDEYNNHKAIARILKSYYFQYIIDLYGDAPYSQALQGGDVLTPAYDDDQAVYRGLIEDINLALATLTSTENNALPVGPEDTVFQGDLNGWVEVANTLKLRILLRQSELAGSDADTASHLATEFASLSSASFVTTDATLNPGYVNEAGRLNPFWTNYGFDVAGVPTFDHDFIVPSEYFEKFLKGENQTDADFNVGGLPGTGVNDVRLERFFDPNTGVGGSVTGVVQGAENSQAPTSLSEPGPGLLRGFDQDSYIFTAAESFLLQAEAIEKGYLSGNAQAMFENGITASFNLLGIPGDAAAYITASANVNRIGWAGSANKIEAIMTQKWIALSGFNAIESFIDYNRTGFPDVPLSVIAEKPNRPYRLLYPASEYSTNSANVPNQPSSAAFSDKIFWDVN